MPSPPAPISFDLDIAGTSSNNRIVDEQYELIGSSTNRVLVPKYSPFFPSSYANSLVLTDNATNLPLVRGTDYHIVEFHQELSMKYGKELASGIVVTNPNVSSTGRLSYQTIGWHYVNNSYAIKKLYESLIDDDRAVSWESILNKPIEHPPTNHRHLLYDVYGFEPVVDGLERIKRAVSLGQTGLAIRIIDKLMARFNFGELENNIPSKRLVSYDALLAKLTDLRLLSNLRIRFLNGPRRKGRSFSVEIDARDNNVANRIVYLTIQGNSNNAGLITYSFPDPNSPSDSNHIRLNADNKAIVYFYINTNGEIRGDNLYVGVRLSIDRPDFDAVTYDIDAIAIKEVSDYYIRRTDSTNYLLIAQMEDIPPIYRFRDIAASPRRGLFYRYHQN